MPRPTSYIFQSCSVRWDVPIQILSCHPVACLRTGGSKRLEWAYSGPVPDLEIRRVAYDFSGAKLASVCAENAVCSLDLDRTIDGAASLASEIDVRFRTFELHFLFPEHRANLRLVADGRSPLTVHSARNGRLLMRQASAASLLESKKPVSHDDNHLAALRSRGYPPILGGGIVRNRRVA